MSPRGRGDFWNVAISWILCSGFLRVKSTGQIGQFSLNLLARSASKLFPLLFLLNNGGGGGGEGYGVILRSISHVKMTRKVCLA